MFALPVAYGASVILGIPTFLVFRYFGWLSRSVLLFGASGIGFLIGVVFACVFASSDPLGFVGAVLIFTAFGAASGYAFWFLTHRAPNPLNTAGPDS